MKDKQGSDDSRRIHYFYIKLIPLRVDVMRIMFLRLSLKEFVSRLQCLGKVVSVNSGGLVYVKFVLKAIYSVWSSCRVSVSIGDIFFIKVIVPGSWLVVSSVANNHELTSYQLP